MANKPKEINWDLVELYIKSGATQKRICGYLQIDEETLRKRVRDKYKMEYSVFSAGLHCQGELLLEAQQFNKALNNSSPGNSQMLIWLGKVRLGQRDTDLVQTTAPLQDNIDKDQLIMQQQFMIDQLKEKLGMNGNKPETE